ncbi:hypothetical protein [Dictyobacter arantiisoli]|uniref:hypothetical protein n=1 Tax=Dictyobacter arantiisoli TaxID=2014874 RepID=UPI0011ED9B86|nr:hypothetical protein [Dictyobacter arantiisoli]
MKKKVYDASHFRSWNIRVADPISSCSRAKAAKTGNSDERHDDATDKKPDLQFSLAGDIYIAQCRPGFPQLLVNQDYERVAILDVWNAQIITTIPFVVHKLPVRPFWGSKMSAGVKVRTPPRSIG